MNKRITFLLSHSGQKPIGGFKIIYEYANRLTQRGWHVTIIHPSSLWNKNYPLGKANKLKSILKYFFKLLTRTYLPSAWMKIDSRIRMLWTLTLEERWIPDADYVVACPVEATFSAVNYSDKKGKKIYFIQHFEDWDIPKLLVEKSWKFSFKKIVIAKWLQDIAHSLNEDATYIPNGLDFSFFKKIKSMDQRPPFSICFLYHQLAWKGTRFALEAMRILKDKYPELTVTVFCAYPISEKLPDFIKKFIDPDQNTLREIYNSNTIFISPSIAEGWPLPPAEAMLCGCVVIATDIGGHREYIDNTINGFFCKPESAESIVDKVEYIFQTPKVAAIISETAPATLHKFDWESRVGLFEKALDS